MLDMLIKEAEAIALPCYDLIPANQGDDVLAYWGGKRSDLSEKFPSFVGAYKSRRHVLSVDASLFDSLGLKGRFPFALALDTTRDDDEEAHPVPLASGSLSGVSFKGAVPLKAVESVSMPPLEAVLLYYGGSGIDSWMAELGLRRWEYSDLTGSVVQEYQSYFSQRNPLMSETPPFARVGGWHLLWSDDDYYIPREMRLMLWTFEDSEPWYEVFLTVMRNYAIKGRVT